MLFKATPLIVEIPLSQHEFDALLSFNYNLGSENLGSSTLLRQLNEDRKEEASLQFGLWAKSGGLYLPGLAKRRFAEMLIFRNDEIIPYDELQGITFNKGSTNLLERYLNLSSSQKNEIVSIYTNYKSDRR